MFFPIDFFVHFFFFLAPSSYHPKSPRFLTLSFSVFCMREIFMNNEVNVQVQNLMYIFLLSFYTFSTISIDFLWYIFILIHLTFCYLLLLWKIIQLFFLLKCTYNTHKNYETGKNYVWKENDYRFSIFTISIAIFSPFFYAMKFRKFSNVFCVSFWCF